MSLTGDFVDAATALRIGLANHVVSHHELRSFAVGLARAIAEQDPALVRAVREDWDATDRLPLAEAHRIHREHAERSGFTGASASGIAAHREVVIDRARQQR